MIRCTLTIFTCLMVAMAPVPAAEPAASGLELFASEDADKTSVDRLAATAFVHWIDADHHLGLTVERARFRPLGDSGWTDHRVYVRFAGTHDALKWIGKLGTDGDSLLGSATLVREQAWRQEYFVEREVLETLSGADGAYTTFAGAAIDIPLDSGAGQQLTLLVGLQTFPGDNIRRHLRAVYSLPLSPEHGLALQVRARSFHNSEPRELDYYSPKRFHEVLPQLRLRQFHGGWMFSVSGGVGRQRDTDSRWRAARMAELTVESPRWAGDWYLRTHVHVSNNPVGDGTNYGYRQVQMQLVRAF